MVFLAVESIGMRGVLGDRRIQLLDGEMDVALAELMLSRLQKRASIADRRRIRRRYRASQIGPNEQETHAHRQWAAEEDGEEQAAEVEAGGAAQAPRVFR